MPRASDANKKVVESFYNMAFNEHRPGEAAQKYLGRVYTQHNPQAGDGPQAFIDFVTGWTKSNPNLSAEIKRVVAEGDLVVAHVHIKTNSQDRGIAAMDIFRVADGRIVEHWDVIQPVPETAANQNTMF